MTEFGFSEKAPKSLNSNPCKRLDLDGKYFQRCNKKLNFASGYQ